MRKIVSKLALNALHKSHEACLNGLASVPKKGWVRTLREAFLISSAELAKKMKISYQAVLKFEKKELQGEVTIKKMKALADALDCEFVYYLVPKKGSFQENNKAQIRKKKPGFLD